ncbi:ABC transporter transmembrane domain-containing protein [Roseibium salinum]|nr:ABC transporter transmembrane domain-containing protein [Roseibium salinum]
MAFPTFLWIPQAGLVSLALGALLASVTGGQDSDAAQLLMSNPVVWAIAGLPLLALFRTWLQTRALNMARQTARAIQGRARAEVLRAAVQRSPAAAFSVLRRFFAAQLTEQVDLLGPYYRNYVPQLIRLKLVPFGIVLATAVFSWLAALILLVCGPLIPLFMALIGIRAKAASANQQEELTRLSGLLMDRIRGLETLILFGAVERTQDDIRDAGERFRTGTMRVLKIAFLSSTVLELFFRTRHCLFRGLCRLFRCWATLKQATGVPRSAIPPASSSCFWHRSFFAPLRAYAAAYHDRAGGIAAQEKNWPRCLGKSRSRRPSLPVMNAPLRRVRQVWLHRPPFTSPR